MPAEWVEHEQTLMCWPSRDSIWGAHRAQAIEDYLGVAAAVASCEPVTMIAPPRYSAEAAEACSAIPGDVTVLEIPIDDSWARDSGPLVAISAAGERVVMNPRFNSWGEKFLPYSNDAALAQRWAAHHRLPVIDDTMVLEGGSITVDGQGTVITTEQCLLHPNRNPQMSQQEIADSLRRLLGAEHVIWLPFGLALDDDTDGHVDNVAAFVGPGEVLIQQCDDDREADHHRLRQNLEVLNSSVDAARAPLNSTVVPVLPFAELGGQRMAVPYLNLYLCNGGVVVPVSGHPADSEMLELIGTALPGRRVLPVPAVAIAYGGGGPHCITQQIPRDPLQSAPQSEGSTE